MIFGVKEYTRASDDDKRRVNAWLAKLGPPLVGNVIEVEFEPGAGTSVPVKITCYKIRHGQRYVEGTPPKAAKHVRTVHVDEPFPVQP